MEPIDMNIFSQEKHSTAAIFHFIEPRFPGVEVQNGPRGTPEEGVLKRKTRSCIRSRDIAKEIILPKRCLFEVHSAVFVLKAGKADIRLRVRMDGQAALSFTAQLNTLMAYYNNKSGMLHEWGGNPRFAVKAA